MNNELKNIIAVVDPNTLAAVGMRQLLQAAVPSAEVAVFGSFAELQANRPETMAHFFVAFSIFLENRTFFEEYRRKTIVLVPSASTEGALQTFHTLCTSQPERLLAASVAALRRQGHARAQDTPPVLTDREIQVLTLIVRGNLNKQIAGMLGIALTTVITHRRNIMKKLRARSVAALAVHAVTHGYVDIDDVI